MRAGYDYDHRYLLDLVGTCSGSAFLEQGKKFRFYPAVSAAWILSNEAFLEDASALNLLKLRASYGVCGYDARLGYGLDTPNNGSGGGFIAMIGSSEPGMMQGSYPSYGALPETDYKANIGLDIRAFEGLEISAELFRNHRKNIKVSSSGVYSSILGLGAPYIFNGETLNWGAELSASWSRTVGDWSWHLGGTISYTKDKILEMGEEFHPYPYQYRTGHSITALTSTAATASTARTTSIRRVRFCRPTRRAPLTARPCSRETCATRTSTATASSMSTTRSIWMSTTACLRQSMVCSLEPSGRASG